MTGHVANITIKDQYVDPARTPGVPADYEWYHDLALYYSSSGKLWRVLRDQWKEPSPGQFSDYTKVAAREFYYDAPWERYLDRDVDPNNNWTPIGAGRWSDYERSLIYEDFLHTPPGGPDEQMRYLSELGTHGQQTVSTGATGYLHGDLIDSTGLLTDGQGAPAGTTAYTAFGEAIGDPAGLGTRYQYAGGWGYESGLLELGGANPALPPVTLQHVGWRWYQPSIGRFMQRDPIGLEAGLNVYEYCDGNPLGGVDPTGEGFWDGDNWFHDWIARKLWMKIHSTETLARMSNRRATAEAIGASVVGGVATYYAAPYIVKGGFRVFGKGVKMGWHFGHRHVFKFFGRRYRLFHYQVIIYTIGTRSSHRPPIRIPVPDFLCIRVWPW